jgi:hypothetical protein
MTDITVQPMDTGPAGEAPPVGTAIVRPLRHVRAVREHHMLQFTDAAEATASRSGRAWTWALGETAIAPVTDLITDTPPSRCQIQVEVATADDGRLLGDRANRADGAATILRWLIGEDDHVPLRGENLGELVGGFGDIVRSRKDLSGGIADAIAARQLAAARGRDLEASTEDRLRGQEDAAYFDGVAATLAWILGERAESPITCTRQREPTTKVMKTERVHALDVAEQRRRPRMADRLIPMPYGKGVNAAITWLLGDAVVILDPENG